MQRLSCFLLQEGKAKTMGGVSPTKQVIFVWNRLIVPRSKLNTILILSILIHNSVSFPLFNTTTMLWLHTQGLYLFSFCHTATKYSRYLKIFASILITFLWKCSTFTSSNFKFWAIATLNILKYWCLFAQTLTNSQGSFYHQTTANNLTAGKQA